MQPSTLAKRGSLFLFLALIGFYLYGLGHLPLVGPDEPRYAQVAREMLLRGDWITPTIGGHLWFEKPSLLYWMMIVSYKLFGVSEWSARLPSAVSGLLTIAAVFWVGKRAEFTSAEKPVTGVGFWSALVLGTSIGIVAFARAASFDMIVTMTTTWALGCFIVSETETDAKRRRILLAGFYFFIGLSLLAKGLVGFVVPLGVAGAYFIVRAKAPDRVISTSLLWGLPLSIAVAAVWYGPMIWKHGSPFINQFIIQHHFARYLSNKYRHPGPIYYYLVVLILLPLPWTAFVIDGILQVRTWLWRAGDSVNKIRVFALVWILLPLIFFSFSGSKLPGYILLVLPAAALIVGQRLARITSVIERESWSFRTTGFLCIILSAVAVLYAWRSGNLTPVAPLMITLPFALAGCIALVATRGRSTALVLIGIATVTSLVGALHRAAPQFAARESAKHLLQLAEAKGYGQTPIYGLQPDDRTPEFYAAGRVAYDSDGEPVLYVGPPQLATEVDRRQEVLLAFVPLLDVTLLGETKAVQRELIGTNGRFALVAVKPR